MIMMIRMENGLFADGAAAAPRDSTSPPVVDVGLLVAAEYIGLSLCDAAVVKWWMLVVVLVISCVGRSKDRDLVFAPSLFSWRSVNGLE